VADFSWNTQSPLNKAFVAGRHGITAGPAGVTLSELRDVGLVQVMARRGKTVETIKAAKKLFGVEPPSTPKAVTSMTATLIWSGPDQFLALAARSSEDQFGKFARAFAGIASLSDQSDGRCLIQVSGPRARAVLAKFSSLDLHDTAFPIGTAATSSVDHTAVNIWREANRADGQVVFNLLVFTSFADSLGHIIVDSSLEYGVETIARAA
jgi:methylglutamate dehydrogenase subunit D